MSRTNRKTNKKWENFGEEWKKTADKKKPHKPNSKFKKNESKKRKQKPKQALRNAIAQDADFDSLALPIEKKENDWNWL